MSSEKIRCFLLCIPVLVRRVSRYDVLSMYCRPAGLAPARAGVGVRGGLEIPVPFPTASPLRSLYHQVHKQLHILPFVGLSFICDTSCPPSLFLLSYSGKTTSLSLISITHMNTVLASPRTLPVIFTLSRDSKPTRNVICHAMRSSDSEIMNRKGNGHGVLVIQKPPNPPPKSRRPQHYAPTSRHGLP